MADATNDDAALGAALAETWARVRELTERVEPQRWKAPSELPGWDARDVLAHLIGIESVILGRDLPSDAPEVAAEHPIAHANLTWVAWYRTQPVERALRDFAAVADERLAWFASATTADFDEPSWTPMGPGTIRTLMPFRIFDSFVHEQDIRTALHEPGGWVGAAAEAAVERMQGAMPYVVGKLVAPPDGTVVVFECTGPFARTFVLQVANGRAHLYPEVPAEVSVRLRMDTPTFVRLSTGRGDPYAITAAHVEIEGDGELARRVIGAMNVLF